MVKKLVLAVALLLLITHSTGSECIEWTAIDSSECPDELDDILDDDCTKDMALNALCEGDETLPGSDVYIDYIDNCDYTWDIFRCTKVDGDTTTAEPTTTAASGKVCSYVANDECLSEWCDDTNTDEFTQSITPSGYLTIDYDCAGIPECPATPTEDNEGMICEADSVFFLGNPGYSGAPEGTVFDMTMPEGTSSDLDNCGEHDVYEVVCTGGEETSAPETTEAAVPAACEDINNPSDCDNASYCKTKYGKQGSFKKCKTGKCGPLSEDTCNAAPHCEPKIRKDGSFKKCKLNKN